LVYTDVPLEWVIFLTNQIYQWDAIFIYVISMGGKFIPGIMKIFTGKYMNGYGFQNY
jgi:hypothetical protein